MRVFPLCRDCAARFDPSQHIKVSADANGCFICKGALSFVPVLLHEAMRQSTGFEWSSFSVSSSFPKPVLVAEQEVADCLYPGQFTSIKNSANALLVDGLKKAAGKVNNQRRAEASFSFDFSKMSVSCTPTPIYIFGRYQKLSRQHCQSRWHCSDCGGKGCPSCGGSGRNYPSVEDELGAALMPAFAASKCTLHASGREDVDVRNLGHGRPFVLEIASPKKRGVDLAAAEQALQKNPNVRATGLRLVGKKFIDAVCNSHFEKEYSALVSADRALTVSDCEKISQLAGKQIKQQTPVRVMHRRADLVRERKIFSISAEPAQGGKLRLRILAEAGTYIKELISSDGDRTKPSVSSLLGCKAACDELDVVCIRDYFLETLQTD